MAALTLSVGGAGVLVAVAVSVAVGLLVSAGVGVGLLVKVGVGQGVSVSAGEGKSGIGCAGVSDCSTKTCRVSDMVRGSSDLESCAERKSRVAPQTTTVEARMVNMARTRLTGYMLPPSLLVFRLSPNISQSGRPWVQALQAVFGVGSSEMLDSKT